MRVLPYRERSGWYASLDERARVLFAVLSGLAALVTFDVAVLLPVALAALSVLLLARIRWREIRSFVFFAVFVVSVLVFLTWLSHGGTPDERRAHAVAQSLRMVSLIALTAVLPFTIEPQRWGVTFRRLGFSDALAFAVELAVRFVPTFAARFETTLRAQSARGLDVSAGVGTVRRLRRLVPVLVPVLLDSIVRSDDVADAMDLRAFGAARRTWSGGGRFGPGEWALVAAGTSLVVLALAS